MPLIADGTGSRVLSNLFCLPYDIRVDLSRKVTIAILRLAGAPRQRGIINLYVIENTHPICHVRILIFTINQL